MPERIIADSSALIGLEKIGLTDILCKIYSEVLLPEAVIEEYGIPDFPCVSIRKVDDNLKSVLSHYANLGKGESEVIVLAYQTGIRAIIDDMKGTKDEFFKQLPEVLNNLTAERETRAVLESFKELLNGDWEFRFTFNYLFRGGMIMDILLMNCLKKIVDFIKNLWECR